MLGRVLEDGEATWEESRKVDEKKRRYDESDQKGSDGGDFTWEAC